MDEIQALVDSPRVVLSNKRGPTKRGDGLRGTRNNFALQMVPELQISCMEGIAAVWETEEGVLESKMLVTANGTASDPLTVSSCHEENNSSHLLQFILSLLKELSLRSSNSFPFQMIQTLKSVWCYKQDKLPYTSILESKLEETINVCYIPKAAEVLFEAKKTNSKRMCPICGKTYAVSVIN